MTEAGQLTHQLVCQAAFLAARVEHALDYEDALHRTRHDWWLTEAELVARVRGALVDQGAASPNEIQINAQGNAALGRMNNDILIGYLPKAAIEVVYCGKSVGRALDSDLAWLLDGPLDGSRHVIGFFPKMRPGYRIQGHATPYNPEGVEIHLASYERVLSDCISCAPLHAQSPTREAYDGLIATIASPRGGKAPRFSLASQVVDSRSSTFQRTVLAAPSDNLWAVVWTS